MKVDVPNAAIGLLRIAGIDVTYDGQNRFTGTAKIELPPQCRVKSFGLTNWQTGLVNAIPFGIAAVWMILWGRSSDRTGERVWHNALPLAWMVLAILATFMAINSLWAMIPLLTLIAAGTYASKGPFWALSSEWLGASSAAAGLAQINALGNLSGFVFNYLIGWIHAETGSFPLALTPIVP